MIPPHIQQLLVAKTPIVFEFVLSAETALALITAVRDRLQEGSPDVLTEDELRDYKPPRLRIIVPSTVGYGNPVQHLYVNSLGEPTWDVIDDRHPFYVGRVRVTQELVTGLLLRLFAAHPVAPFEGYGITSTGARVFDLGTL